MSKVPEKPVGMSIAEAAIEIGVSVRAVRKIASGIKVLLRANVPHPIKLLLKIIINDAISDQPSCVVPERAFLADLLVGERLHEELGTKGQDTNEVADYR